MKPEDVKDFSVDKSAWGAGPWQFEPDRLDFEYDGFSCLLHRGPHGNWCGYVGVAEGHPAFRKGYDYVDVEVHGGLTYSHECNPPICHVPKPGAPDDLWWLGFDCAHAGDFSPKFGNTYRSKDEPVYDHARATLADTWQVERYRTLEYVRAETERLAAQLAKLR